MFAFRTHAVRRSAFGAVRDFLMIPCNSTTLPPDWQKKIRAMRFSRFVRISHKPCPIASHVGIPIGHPYSTFRMSLPMPWRSTSDNDFNHSRTGSLPVSVR
jgi:hypothetical protein